MSAVLVSVDTASGGFAATARQGVREHEAMASSPELAARLAASALLALELPDVRAEWVSPGVWRAIPRRSR